MSNLSTLQNMLLKVATALGPDVLSKVAFVGGCTTGLHITDELSRESVRLTHDVDLVVSIAGMAQWSDFQAKMHKKGFKVSMQQEKICTLMLGDLEVDFLPDDEALLGFSSRWYMLGLASAIPYKLNSEVSIQLLSPAFFLGTKLEAYQGRGNNDPLASHDVEDVLNIFNGRDDIASEVKAAPEELQQYIKEVICELLDHDLFQYAVDSAANGDELRAEIIFERLEHVAGRVQ